jgi:hypothetical protein
MRGSNQAGSHAPKGTPSPASEPVSAFARTVSGRPTGYSAGANERAGKQATRAVFEGCVLPEGCRVQVEIDFLLAPDQVGRVEPDLDNLIKSTVDALESVLGVRSGTGSRTEADHVRVDRIVASKRPARSGEHPGARSWSPNCPKSPSERVGTGMMGGDSAGGEP